VLANSCCVESVSAGWVTHFGPQKQLEAPVGSHTHDVGRGAQGSVGTDDAVLGAERRKARPKMK
jgi:hypothetical protein